MGCRAAQAWTPRSGGSGCGSSRSASAATRASRCCRTWPARRSTICTQFSAFRESKLVAQLFNTLHGKFAFLKCEMKRQAGCLAAGVGRYSASSLHVSALRTVIAAISTSMMETRSSLLTGEQLQRRRNHGQGTMAFAGTALYSIVSQWRVRDSVVHNISARKQPWTQVNNASNRGRGRDAAFIGQQKPHNQKSYVLVAQSSHGQMPMCFFCRDYFCRTSLRY